jgi:hypothetical protein
VSELGTKSLVSKYVVVVAVLKDKDPEKLRFQDDGFTAKATVLRDRFIDAMIKL